MSNPKFHQCCTCGYEWRHGQHGGHDCTATLNAHYEAIREKCAELERQLQTADDTNAICENRIKELRDKLDEAAKQEPVAYIYPAAFGSRASLAKNNKPADWDDDDRPWYEEPLYRHPPNLPAIIEQEMAKEQERIIGILYGIDKTEIEDEKGWWETSFGAKFGLSILAAIRARKP